MNGTVEIAGPEQFRMAEIVQRYLRAIGDSREVVGDPKTPYFGAVIDDKSLVPDAGARLGGVRFETWLSKQRKAS